jgi:hypothetical protein
MGVPRVDEAPTLARHVKKTLVRPAPPVPGTLIKQPRAPRPTPPPKKPGKWKGALNQPMPALVTRDGSTLPAPTDGVVRPKPPKSPNPH